MWTLFIARLHWVDSWWVKFTSLTVHHKRNNLPNGVIPKNKEENVEDNEVFNYDGNYIEEDTHRKRKKR